MLDFYQDSDTPSFYADSGDVHLKYDANTDTETRQALVKGELFVKVGERVRLDAQGVGELDLALGWPALLELYEGSKVPLICGNLRQTELYELDDAEGRSDAGGAEASPVSTGPRVRPRPMNQTSDEYPLPAWRIVEREGVAVGFIGALSPQIELPDNVAPQLAIDPVVPMLKGAIEDLRAEEVDLIVLVSHMGMAEDKRIAAEVPGIDVILGGHSKDTTGEPEISGGVPIVQAGRKGQRIGRLDLWFDPHGEHGAVKVEPAEVADKVPPKRLGFVNRIEVLRKKVLMADQVVERWVAESKAAVAAVPKEEAPEPEGPKSAFAAVDAFWGPEVCAACHTEQSDWWKKTQHARAYETLEKEEKQFDTGCITCHTLGYRDPAGFREPKDIPEMFKNVSCEHCHGRGTQHGQEGVFNVAVRNEQTCLRCHTPDNDDTWSVAKIDQIACPPMKRSGG